MLATQLNASGAWASLHACRETDLVFLDGCKVPCDWLAVLVDHRVGEVNVTCRSEVVPHPKVPVKAGDEALGGQQRPGLGGAVRWRRVIR